MSPTRQLDYASKHRNLREGDGEPWTNWARSSTQKLNAENDMPTEESEHTLSLAVIT